MSFGGNRGAVDTNVPIHIQRKKLADKRRLMEEQAQDHTDRLVAQGIIPAEEAEEHPSMGSGRRVVVDIPGERKQHKAEKTLSFRVPHAMTIAGQRFEPSRLPPIRVEALHHSETKVFGGFRVPVVEQQRFSPEGVMEAVMEVLTDPADLVVVSEIAFRAVEQIAADKPANSVWGRALAKIARNDPTSMIRGENGKVIGGARLVVHQSSVQ